MDGDGRHTKKNGQSIFEGKQTKKGKEEICHESLLT